MPQTATRPVTGHTAVRTSFKAETPAERNIRLYGCPLDHTPNAETIKAFNEPVIAFDTLEEFFADLYSDDDEGCASEHIPNAKAIEAIEIANAIRNGKIPDRQYNSLEDILAYLHAYTKIKKYFQKRC